VNFCKYLDEVIRETEAFRKLGYKVPHSAATLHVTYDQLKFAHHELVQLASRYNRLR